MEGHKGLDYKRVARISYNPSDLNPRSMYHKLILELSELIFHELI